MVLFQIDRAKEYLVGYEQGLVFIVIQIMNDVLTLEFFLLMPYLLAGFLGPVYKKWLSSVKSVAS